MSGSVNIRNIYLSVSLFHHLEADYDFWDINPIPN